MFLIRPDEFLFPPGLEELFSNLLSIHLMSNVCIVSIANVVIKVRNVVYPTNVLYFYDSIKVRKSPYYPPD